jgi:translocation and assembly module TamB
LVKRIAAITAITLLSVLILVVLTLSLLLGTQTGSRWGG